MLRIVGFAFCISAILSGSVERFNSVDNTIDGGVDSVEA